MALAGTQPARIQNWIQDAERCVHGLRTFTQADSIRELTTATLKKTYGDSWRVLWQIKIRARIDGTFDVLVFRSLKHGRDAYTIEPPHVSLKKRKGGGA